MKLDRWEFPDPADIIALDTNADWLSLEKDYSDHFAFRRCLSVARKGGARCVVVETRYVDPDYRSEYSAFYSKTFQPMLDTARRLHFFDRRVSAAQLTALPAGTRYLGYMVVRPSELGAVGRTMLAPPPDMRRAVTTAVRDRVNFFGRTLQITAAPFMQQDTRFLVCAHAASWMCHYSGFLRGDAPRALMADLPATVDPGLGGFGRPLPSPGLTVPQILELMRRLSLPPDYYDLDNLPPPPLVPWVKPLAQPDPLDPTGLAGRILPIACRYLNSGIPVMVATQDHTFMLCGYQRDRRPGLPDRITLIRNDDQLGPYLPVSNPLKDVDPGTGHQYTPWSCLIIPLPEKLWLPAEPAEQLGALYLQTVAKSVVSKIPDAKRLLDLIARGRLALRTYAIASNVFKSGLSARGVDSGLVREYRLARMSRLIWVIEAVDRDLRAARRPPVIGEAVFDATSSENEPYLLALHVPGVAWVRRVGGPARFPVRCSPNPYGSGAIAPL